MGRKLRFEWDRANIGHVARHAVTPGECEQVFTRPTWEQHSDRDGEPRNFAVGRTDKGRYLCVYYTMRSGSIRVVTAYPANRKWRKIYGESFQ
jgi:uncharacterized protein